MIPRIKKTAIVMPLHEKGLIHLKSNYQPLWEIVCGPKYFAK